MVCPGTEYILELGLELLGLQMCATTHGLYSHYYLSFTPSPVNCCGRDRRKKVLALRSRCSQDGGSQTLTFLVGDIACAEDFSVAATRWLLRPEACHVRPSRPCRRANEAAPVPVQQLRSLYQMNISRHLHSQHSSMKGVSSQGLACWGTAGLWRLWVTLR